MTGDKIERETGWETGWRSRQGLNSLGFVLIMNHNWEPCRTLSEEGRDEGLGTFIDSALLRPLTARVQLSRQQVPFPRTSLEELLQDWVSIYSQCLALNPEQRRFKQPVLAELKEPSGSPRHAQHFKSIVLMIRSLVLCPPPLCSGNPTAWPLLNPAGVPTPASLRDTSNSVSCATPIF